jgi:hypothetical protein
MVKRKGQPGDRDGRDSLRRIGTPARSPAPLPDDAEVPDAADSTGVVLDTPRAGGAGLGRVRPSGRASLVHQPSWDRTEKGLYVDAGNGPE